ncbi:MAG: SPOR domain-containing protein [Candidatus Omnitrophica bacterium]|nr:SPOR domain-containing protein [Candidatus Omnitrophota bacterium]
MGKYSEALRKIEEERLKGKVTPLSLSAQPKQSRKWKGYAIGATVFIAIILLSVYAHGVRKGMRAAETLSLEASLPPAEEPEPIGSVGQLAESGKDELLLNSLEGMMKLSYQENPSVSEAQSASNNEEPTPAPPPQNFYTIQLASFQNVESAREEAKKLMDQGYQAIVLRSSKYYSVCVDKFENAAQAAERLIQLKDAFGGGVYQDTFVRFVRQKQAAEE